MDLLRSLADGGRTVIAVTHSIQSLDRCDRILFLAPGGQTAFFGPPDETLGFFNRPQYADVFLDLEKAAPGYAKAAFSSSQPDQKYVRQPLSIQMQKLQNAGPAAVAVTPAVNPHFGHQLSTLFRRFASVGMADRRNTMMLFATPPSLALLMRAVLGPNDFSSSAPPVSRKS